MSRKAQPTVPDVSTTYDPGFFAMHQPWRGEYDIIADVLAGLLDFSTVLDLGCGNGFLIDRLHQRGKEVSGVDGSVHALHAAPPPMQSKIVLADLTAPIRLGRFDLVICSEVAEHIAARHADTLVDSLCANARSSVFFTAATPGQGGHSHVNEQPHEYWIGKFEHRGFRFDDEATRLIRFKLSQAINTVWWFGKNAMILRAPAGPD